MANAINVADLASNLGNYCRENNGMIFTQALNGIDTLLEGSGITVMDNITSETPLVNVSAGDLIQPGDSLSWNSKADSLKYGNRNLAVKNFKIDMDIVPEQYRNLWLAHNRKQRGIMKDFQDIPFYEYIVKVIMQKMNMELYWATFAGIYAPPTPGTPNPAKTWADVCDGFLKHIATEVTATNVTVVATGASTTANVVANIEKVANKLGSFTADMTQGGVIFVSNQNYLDYVQNVPTTLGRQLSFDELGKGGALMARGTNVKIVRTPAFDKAGKPNAMVATINDNFFVGTDVYNDKNNIEVQKDKRILNVLIDGVWGTNFALCNKTDNPIVVNDQI